MKSNKDIKKLISFIKAKTGLSQQAIADRAGYGRTYLSDAARKGTEVVWDRLYSCFAEELDLNNYFSTEHNQTITTSPKTAETILGDTLERLMRLEANVSVSNQVLDLLSSVQTGKSVALVSGERQKAVSMEIDRLYAELHKKSVNQ